MKHKQEVLDALRSGEWEQHMGSLGRGDNKRCCLGVMCEVALNHLDLDRHVLDVTGLVSFVVDGEDEGDHYLLPEMVADYFGFDHTNPYLPAGAEINGILVAEVFFERSGNVFYADVCASSFRPRLSDLNDAGFSFEEIADLIERYL